MRNEERYRGLHDEEGSLPLAPIRFPFLPHPLSLPSFLPDAPALNGGPPFPPSLPREGTI